MIGRARAAAARHCDPAIGFVFDTIDVVQALTAEAEFPADIVLWHGSRPNDSHTGVEAALVAAGDLVIGDSAVGQSRVRAA